MTLVRLSALLADAEGQLRWRLLAEFLEEFSWEPAVERLRLLADAPSMTGDERWDALLAALCRAPGRP